MALNWLDICVLVIIALSSIFGLWRGLVREVLAVLAWVAALVVARIYSPVLAPAFGGLIENETARYVLAFALICLGVLIVGAVVNRFMARLVTFAGLQVTDRMLGALFGVLRGVLIVAILIYFGAGFYSQEHWWQMSYTIPYIEDVIDWSFSLFGIETGTGV